MTNRIHLYRYAFPDGTAYIGRTYDMGKRDAAHRQAGDPLEKILLRNPETEMELLSIHNGEKPAMLRQAQIIRDTPKPLNETYPDGAKVRHCANRPQSAYAAGNLICAVCRATKPATEFYKAGNNAPAANCKMCQDALDAAVRAAKIKGKDERRARANTKRFLQKQGETR